MTSRKQYRESAQLVRKATTDDFVELVTMAGLDPIQHFKQANLRGVNFGRSDLRTFSFLGADLSGADLSRAIYNVKDFDGAMVDSKTRFNTKVVPDNVIIIDHQIDESNENIIVLTPKGEKVILPSGSTPLDFAFAVHSELGSQTVGAKIDGNRVPLWTRIKNGQSVAIISAEGQSPQVSWLEMVETKSAYRKISRHLSRDEKERKMLLLDKYIDVQIATNIRNETKIANFRQIFSRLADFFVDDLISKDRVNSELFGTLLIGVFSTYSPGRIRSPFVGTPNNQQHRLCLECLPFPGERIVGIVAKGSVEVHSIQCDRLEIFEKYPGIWIDMRWDFSAQYPDRIFQEIDAFPQQVIMRVRKQIDQRLVQLQKYRAKRRSEEKWDT